MTSGQETGRGSRWRVYFHSDEGVGGQMTCVPNAFWIACFHHFLESSWLASSEVWVRMLFGVPSLTGRFGWFLSLAGWPLKYLFCYITVCFNEKVEAMGRGDSRRKKKVKPIHGASRVPSWKGQTSSGRVKYTGSAKTRCVTWDISDSLTSRS